MRSLHLNPTGAPPASSTGPSPMSSPALPPIVLAFAATDPTGGAGQQAALLTLSSTGCHAPSEKTPITIQDTAGVANLQAVDYAKVADQAAVMLDETTVATFKVVPG